MENVIFPDSFHLRTMLANCDVVTPITYPEYGINYPAEIYPYRSALWQKFLVESQGDSTIIRNIWEGYGEEYATGNLVDLFPIYDNAIRSVTDNNYDLDNAYKDYAIWRYFTGDRSISNNYFNESSYYCESTSFILDDALENTFSNSISNKGGASYIQLPLYDINIKLSTPNPEHIRVSYLSVDLNNNVISQDLEINNMDEFFDFDAQNLLSHTILVYPSYINSLDNISFDVSVVDYINGDINFDQVLNILDVVIIVNFALEETFPTDLELQIADMNVDGVINILDVVQLINQILD
jgi:hypothetical protein